MPGAAFSGNYTHNIDPKGRVTIPAAYRDALGVNFYDSTVDVSPYEAAGKYYNYWYHDGHRYYNDVTENAVLFLLD